jgi:hypothetical protein
MPTAFSKTETRAPFGLKAISHLGTRQGFLISRDCLISSGCNQGSSGVDVMITIFCDFSQFSAKKLAFFQKQML